MYKKCLHTNAYSRALPKRHKCKLVSICFLFFGETFGIENIRIRKISLIIVNSIPWDYDHGTFFDYKIRVWNFVIFIALSGY